MDILYLGTLPPHPGGSAIVADQVLPRLAARGHRIRAISGSTVPIEEQETIDRSALPGLETFRYRIPVNITDTSSLTLPIQRSERPGLRAASRRAFAGGCPDVVVAGRSSFTIDAAILARASRVPLVRIEHSRHTGALASRDAAYVSRLTHAISHVAMTVLVARNLLEIHTGRPAVVVANAIETDRFHPQPRDPALAARLGIPPDAVVVLHPSNLKTLKRVEDLVAAMPAVVARVPGTRLVIVGDGTERPALERAVAASGLSSVATMVGWRPREEMPAWYALADIVVMPSTTEAMSMAGLEAMASGRVLIASDIPAFWETIDDGVDGLLFPVGDVAALADRIASVAADPDLRARIGAAARERALGWSMDRLVTGWESAIETVVRGPAGGRGAG